VLRQGASGLEVKTSVLKRGASCNRAEDWERGARDLERRGSKSCGHCREAKPWRHSQRGNCDNLALRRSIRLRQQHSIRFFHVLNYRNDM
ncbi:hypothetical protein KC19_VG209000, partial [Ceratodon purpureus]